MVNNKKVMTLQGLLTTWPRLFKGWITLSSRINPVDSVIQPLNNRGQAPVVQRLDNAIQWISVDKTKHAIRWIVIYPVDSAIHFSNNPSQGNSKKKV